MSRSTGVRAKRIYDDPSPSDGVRVLVDRVWPRGVSKQRAHVDEWLKAVAPSTELRSWYGHDPALFDEFVCPYQAELAEPERAEALAHLKTLAKQSRVTLLTATRDLELSQAAVLAELLR
jgi:uncharacterized protein YeaO (DUF488 family)